MPSLVTLENICKYYGQVKLLEDISLTLNKGEISMLLGQNGAGKTTLARIIVGLEDASGGDVKLKSGLQICYVPQELSYEKHLPLTVKGLIEIISSKKASARHGFNLPEELADFCDYQKIANHQIETLSGGQLQKVMLTASMFSSAELLILDEPTHYLDVKGSQDFYRLIKHFCKKNNKAVLIISHDLFTVMKSADQVICINKNICCTGKPMDISKNSNLKTAISSIANKDYEVALYIHKHNNEN